MFDYLEIHSNVYYLKFKDNIDVSLSFWRYQEYYESKQFKGRVFTLSDFVHHYGVKHDQDFTYFGYWSGFNLPSWVLFEVWKRGIKDENKYDLAFKKFVQKIGKRKFYIISCFPKDTETLKHEIAHGLYTMNLNYQKEIKRELRRVPRKISKRAFKMLSKSGYHRSVHQDELHAYMLSGQSPDYDFKGDEKYSRRLQEIYTKYARRGKSLYSEFTKLNGRK